MTFYYDDETDTLVGNNMFYEGAYGPIADRNGDTLEIDVTEIMEHGRGMKKLREMQSAIQSAIDAHENV